jgi:hypothetical protein
MGSMQVEDCLLPSTARPLPWSVMARSAYRHTVRAVTRWSIFGVIWASLVLVAEVSAKTGHPPPRPKDQFDMVVRRRLRRSPRTAVRKFASSSESQGSGSSRPSRLVVGLLYLAQLALPDPRPTGCVLLGDLHAWSSGPIADAPIKRLRWLWRGHGSSKRRPVVTPQGLAVGGLIGSWSLSMSSAIS